MFSIDCLSLLRRSQSSRHRPTRRRRKPFKRRMGQVERLVNVPCRKP